MILLICLTASHSRYFTMRDNLGRAGGNKRQRRIVAHDSLTTANRN